MGFFDDLWDGIKQAPKFIINTGKDILHEGAGVVGNVVNTAGGLANNIVNKAGGIVDRGFNTLDKGISGVTGILSNPLLWIAVIAVGVLVLPKLLEARTGGAR